MLLPSLAAVASILYFSFRWSRAPLSPPVQKRVSIYRSVYEELGRLPGLDLKNESSVGLVWDGSPVNLTVPQILPHPYCVQKFPGESEICLLISLVLTPSPIWRLCGVELPDRRSVAARGLFGSEIISNHTAQLLHALGARTPLESEISTAISKISRAEEISAFLGLEDSVTLDDLRWAATILGGWGWRGGGGGQATEFSPYFVFFRFSDSGTPFARNFRSSPEREIFLDASPFFSAAWAFVYRGISDRQFPIFASFGRCGRVALTTGDLAGLVDCAVIGNFSPAGRERQAVDAVLQWVRSEISSLHLGNAEILDMLAESDSAATVDKFPIVRVREQYARALALLEQLSASRLRRFTAEFWE